MKEVAVLPEFRRKKYGDFIVRLLIDKAMMSGAQMINADVLQGAVPLLRQLDLKQVVSCMKRSESNGFRCSFRQKAFTKCCNCGH